MPRIDRRETLRRLIDMAERSISERGLVALRADLAKEAGSAVDGDLSCF